MLLLVGDDWAEEHHDVEVQDETGRVLGRAKLPEGVAGMTRLHAMIGEALGEDDENATVVVGIETERGPWVQALIAAGYLVYAINPLQVARFRQRHGVSGAKSDTADAHVLADMVRTDRHQLRPVAGDTPDVDAIKVIARAHKTLIWERTRHVRRLRHGLRDFFPAALVAFDHLSAPDTLALLAVAPDPVTAARSPADRADLRRAQGGPAASGRGQGRADLLRPAGRAPGSAGRRERRVRRHRAGPGSNPDHTQRGDQNVGTEQVDAHFGKHPDAEIFLSQPGLGVVLAARVLAEFGDDKTRYTDARARKNYAGTSPITRQSGRKKHVMARYVHNDRLVDALGLQAFAALIRSPGARAYYDQLRARGAGRRAALRQLANRLVGILHGCLKTGTIYNEHTAWAHHVQDQPEAA